MTLVVVLVGVAGVTIRKLLFAKHTIYLSQDNRNWLEKVSCVAEASVST